MPSLETKTLETKKNLHNSRKNKDIKKTKLKYLHNYWNNIMEIDNISSEYTKIIGTCDNP